jgi:hypothetical protein
MASCACGRLEQELRLQETSIAPAPSAWRTINQKKKMMKTPRYYTPFLFRLPGSGFKKKYAEKLYCLVLLG